MSKLSDFVGAPEGMISKYEEFIVSGTWTKDPDATWVYVECIGGGGGGGGANTSTANAGGGNGGERVDRFFRASDLPSLVSVTVGAGGGSSSGANGRDGGDSLFSTLNAKGGQGGYFSTNVYYLGYRGYVASTGAGSNTALPFNIKELNFQNFGLGGFPIDQNYLLTGNSCVHGGAGGGAANNNTNPNNGGVSDFGGSGGQGGRATSDTNETVAATDGMPPGGGGGGHCYGFPSGAGGDGVVRIWQW